MPPSTFFINPAGHRCHTAGTGANPHRRQLPAVLLNELYAKYGDDCIGGGKVRSEEWFRFLRSRGYWDVHDAGARRYLLLLRSRMDAKLCHGENARQLWEETKLANGKSFFAPDRPPGG